MNHPCFHLKFFHSGFSVVILARKVNSAGFEILKHPLSSVEYKRLDYLLDTDVPDRHMELSLVEILVLPH